MAGTSRVLTDGAGCEEIARDAAAAWRVGEGRVSAVVVRECAMRTGACLRLVQC